MLDLAAVAPIAAWAVAVAAWDVRRGEIPPWLTWPVILGSALRLALAGMWAPLALFCWFFAWDTTWDDLQALVGRPARGDERWLLPEPVGWAGTLLGVALAAGQGEPALAVALPWALLHGLWRVARRAGGDVAFAMAAFGLFPSLDVWPAPLAAAVLALGLEVVRCPREALRAVRALWRLGPAAAWTVWRARPGAGPRPQGPTIAAMVLLMAAFAGSRGIWNL